MLAVNRAGGRRGRRAPRRGLETLGQCDSARRVTVPAEDDELVATEPADGVVRPGPGDQPPAIWRSSSSPTSCPSESLTSLKPSTSRKRTVTGGRSGPLQFGVDELAESSTVRQCGEIVVPGLPRRHLLHQDPLGHIGVGDDDLPSSPTREARRWYQRVPVGCRTE
jgi:hypothetical protein